MNQNGKYEENMKAMLQRQREWYEKRDTETSQQHVQILEQNQLTREK